MNPLFSSRELPSEAKVRMRELVDDFLLKHGPLPPKPNGDTAEWHLFSFLREAMRDEGFSVVYHGDARPEDGFCVLEALETKVISIKRKEGQKGGWNRSLFTLAHEIGHVLYESDQLVKEILLDECDARDIDEQDALEWLCNFAAEALIFSDEHLASVEGRYSVLADQVRALLQLTGASLDASLRAWFNRCAEREDGMQFAAVFYQRVAAGEWVRQGYSFSVELPPRKVSNLKWEEVYQAQKAACTLPDKDDLFAPVYASQVNISEGEERQEESYIQANLYGKYDGLWVFQRLLPPVGAPALASPSVSMWEREHSLRFGMELPTDLLASDAAAGFTFSDGVLSWRGPRVMGIFNVTPDSFSGGEKAPSVEDILAQADAMKAAGVLWVDVGGESTRPGAEPVSADEEMRRVLPVLISLLRRGFLVSVDTMKAEVAEVCLKLGAHFINDVSAGRDPEMFAVCAKHGAPMCLMHMMGEPRTMQEAPEYADVATEVVAFLQQRRRAALEAGVPSVVLDPGLGFGKTSAHNLALLRSVGQLAELDAPLLIGGSRKRMLGEWTGETVASRRDPASLALHTQAAQDGAALLRVHAATEQLQALRFGRVFEIGEDA